MLKIANSTGRYNPPRINFIQFKGVMTMSVQNRGAQDGQEKESQK